MKEGQQVHAFVLRFVQEYTNSAVIAFESAQRMQMLQDAPNHGRHSGNGFQHTRAMAIPTSEKGV